MARNTDDKYVNIFGQSQKHCFLCIYEWYSWHKMVDFPLTYVPILYSTTKWSSLTTFMLVLMCLCFSWYILVGVGEIANIKC